MTFDRLFDAHFFTMASSGANVMGQPILGRGHPEVYIVILPAFGIFSEIISTSHVPFGYSAMVYQWLQFLY